MAAAHGSALSQHPDAAEATGEVVGRVLEQVGEAPDLAVVFCSAQHGDNLGDIAETVRQVLRPGVLLGATAIAVLAGSTEAEDGPGLAMFAAHLPDRARPVRMTATRTASGMAISGLSAELLTPGGTLVLLADPFSLPVDAILDGMAGAGAHLPVVGGMASAATGPGGNRLVLDGEVVDHGGVGVLLPPGTLTATVVSQGCRPVGDPMIVTAAEDDAIVEIAGLPALDRLDELVAAAGPDERAQLAAGLQLGVAIDEHRETFRRGDFLVRNVLGADRGRRALVVGDVVPVGTTVQFQVRDAASADEDLWVMLGGLAGSAALVFTCNGRGRRFFGASDHDATAVSEALGTSALAGMFCAGEVGPIGDRSFVHGFTASIAVFRAPPSVGTPETGH
jgi:small ligand-binding sensory domain FIST